MSTQIDKNIERVMFHHEEPNPPSNCPQCGETLTQEKGPYQVATRSGRRLTDNYILSGDFGYLCPQCPTAVIHMPNLVKMLYSFPPKAGWKRGPEFAVLGLVNLDAIPPEQSHLPIDQLDPYPLVSFRSIEKDKTRKIRPRKPKPKRRK